MKAFKLKSTYKNNSLEDISLIQTNDGSISLHSHFFKEGFHSSKGALKEAKEKFIIPSSIEKLKSHSPIYILDVCFGLGYNTGVLLESLNIKKTTVSWWGLEIDHRPIQIALQEPVFLNQWSSDVLKILKSIRDTSHWSFENSHGSLLWGDAREQINLLPKDFQAQLILHDAFSPRKCPELWSEEFLSNLVKRLAPGGQLITYCRAAAVRASLRRAGLSLRSLRNTCPKSNSWSEGTIGILPVTTESNSKALEGSPKNLNLMEEEHLLTRAAIPYRDLTGKDSCQEILARRKQEQLDCSLESTTSWRKRWFSG
ncbi:MnmC family methyltransferase [Prochlorococcus sp. MIT 1300]|uniref:MnmC family methyltransferase n=1 Tax=Prochlorococcus sp. MIT 1300 TaxID=3096218 RepID=UPI002A7534A1|nr:MnmC family methyltransferase [Prochlorococcus sp. MIT 1300]